MKIERGYGPRWECDCDEYREIKQRSMKAMCRHRIETMAR
jgi:hypothetical protein